MSIKTLVLSGGSYNGFMMFGALKYLLDVKFYEIENIEKIYATSVGSVIATIIALKISLEDIEVYAVKRPWKKAFDLSTDMLFNMLTEKGIIDKSFFLVIFEKLFKTADISIQSTMMDFYNITKIELHFFSLHLNEFKLIDMSYKTHPDLNIIDALYMSCSIPFIFQPMFYKSSYMIDGAILCNFPLKQCIEDVENLDEILAINIKNTCKDNTKIDKTTNLLKYGHFLFDSLVNYSNKLKQTEKNIKHMLNIVCENSNFNYGYKLLEDSVERENIINKGKKSAEVFFSNL
jgi:predicted acylesterase/phospholipase RssA|tara:strand:- start:537 stop:1406 length:870 start_codon:yes stop_codon:yes gene_type:complete